MCGSVLCLNEWSKTYLRFTKYIWGAASWLQFKGFGSRLIPLIRSVDVESRDEGMSYDSSSECSLEYLF